LEIGDIMKKKKDSKKLKYGLYAALITIIVIIAFILGTGVGFFYATGKPSSPKCQDIRCPDEYKSMYNVDKCELCSETSIIKAKVG
jgi:hypothetical protein